MLTPVTGRGNGAQPKHDPLRVKLYQISVTVWWPFSQRCSFRLSSDTNGLGNLPATKL